MRRRRFLTSLPVLAAAGLAAGSLLPGCGPPRRLRILMLGGTDYVGPHLVEVALARGHEVTLFNRAITNPHLFPRLEKLRGNRYPDRDDGLAALENRRSWDAVLDTWAEEPGCVAVTADLLAGRVARYVYVSSIATYRRYVDSGITEDGPAPDESEHMDSFDPDLSYPVRKRAAEQAVERRFGDRAAVLRCTSVQGFHYSGQEASYWPYRFLSGEPLLVPDDATAVVQLIDVRDAARFAILAIEQASGGPFNLVGPEAPLPFLDYIEAWSDVTDRASPLVRVDPAFLREHGVRPWDDIPSWIPADDHGPGFYRISNARALAHGLTYRPLEATIRDVVASLRDTGVEASTPRMSRERELELIEAWREESGSR